MIIDTHQHLGRSMFTGVETTEMDLLKAMDENGIDVALVMPQPTLEDIPQYHDRIAKAAREHAARIVGIASISPWWSAADYEAEARRCVEQLGFVALKLHPLAHNIAADHAEADKVFRCACDLGVPVIIHTGLGTPSSLPSLCIPPARRYPELAIILAHAGWGVYSSEATVAAEVCESLLLEPSWCPVYAVRKMVDCFGVERILFGSDHLTNMPVELTKYRSIGLSDEQLSLVFQRNPQRVFRLPQ
ncbi:amidohydrolase family protein [Acidobacteria bacterium AH-259-A15]|nr:amidohydrolase family protein [Acidobacteria bacterium AH-259-A15]